MKLVVCIVLLALCLVSAVQARNVSVVSCDTYNIMNNYPVGTCVPSVDPAVDDSGNYKSMVFGCAPDRITWFVFANQDCTGDSDNSYQDVHYCESNNVMFVCDAIPSSQAVVVTEYNEATCQTIWSQDIYLDGECVMNSGSSFMYMCSGNTLSYYSFDDVLCQTPTDSSSANQTYTTATCDSDSEYTYYCHTTPAVFEDPCSTQTSCYDCMEQNDCGWCAGTLTCVHGGITGPSNGTCSGYYYNYENCSAPTDCSIYSTCGICNQASSSCEWCPTTSSCVAWFDSECSTVSTCGAPAPTPTPTPTPAPTPTPRPVPGPGARNVSLVSCYDYSVKAKYALGFCIPTVDPAFDDSGDYKSIVIGCDNDRVTYYMYENMDCTGNYDYNYQYYHECDGATNIMMTCDMIPPSNAVVQIEFWDSQCTQFYSEYVFMDGECVLDSGDSFMYMCSGGQVVQASFSDTLCTQSSGDNNTYAVNTCLDTEYQYTCHALPANYIDPCTSKTSCSSCLDVDNCGWCPTSGQCLRGGPMGPSFTTCPLWQYDVNNCSATLPCNLFANCSMCNTQNNCEWCPTTNTCEDYYTTSCDTTSSCTPVPPMNCAPFNSCSICTAESGCGWCDTTSTCVNGDSTGPSVGICPNYLWTGCPVPSSCPYYTSCSSCTAASSCGWCATLGVCLDGDDDGPSIGVCPNWQYTGCGSPSPSPSPTPSPSPNLQCVINTDCGSCTTSGCGWCSDYGYCYDYGSAIPGMCNNWVFNPQTCSAPPSPTPTGSPGIVTQIIYNTLTCTGTADTTSVVPTGACINSPDTGGSVMYTGCTSSSVYISVWQVANCAGAATVTTPVPNSATNCLSNDDDGTSVTVTCAIGGVTPTPAPSTSGVVTQLVYDSSSTCSGTPDSTDVIPTGNCWNIPDNSGSILYTSCTSSTIYGTMYGSINCVGTPIEYVTTVNQASHCIDRGDGMSVSLVCSTGASPTPAPHPSPAPSSPSTSAGTVHISTCAGQSVVNVETGTCYNAETLGAPFYIKFTGCSSSGVGANYYSDAQCSTTPITTTVLPPNICVEGYKVSCSKHSAAGLSAGIKAVIAIGSILGVAAIGVGVFLFMRDRRAPQKSETHYTRLEA